jgi:hypothetical protein
MGQEVPHLPISDGGSATGSDQPFSDWPFSLPASFYTALAEFNRGDYFQCHETLEALWIPEKRSVRELYQGVLQIAVGCYHLTQRANLTGAVNLLERGARRLERTGIVSSSTDVAIEAPKSCERLSGLYGVDWQGLIAAVECLLNHLGQIGHANVTNYDRLLLPVITCNVERCLRF